MTAVAVFKILEVRPPDGLQERPFPAMVVRGRWAGAVGVAGAVGGEDRSRVDVEWARRAPPNASPEVEKRLMERAPGEDGWFAVVGWFVVEFGGAVPAVPVAAVDSSEDWEAALRWNRKRPWTLTEGVRWGEHGSLSELFKLGMTLAALQVGTTVDRTHLAFSLALGDWRSP